MMQRLALVVFGALGFSTVSWAVLQAVQSAEPVNSNTSLLKIEVVSAPKTEVSIRSEGYIPKGLQSSKRPTKDGSRNVFGPDDRIPMTSRKYPWSAIGRVEGLKADRTLSGWCTGTLIAPDLVVTNAHCVFQGNGEPHPAISFAPNLMDGRSQARAEVVGARVGTRNPERDSADDWAILRLDQPLGNEYGWMEWTNADLGTLTQHQKDFVLVGYSGDFPKTDGGSTAGVHIGCSIRGFEREFGLAMHDCDMTPGASGGPIFYISNQGVGSIVALNSAQRINPEGEYPAEFRRGTANYAVLTRRWASAARELRAEAQR